MCDIHKIGNSNKLCVAKCNDMRLCTSPHFGCPCYEYSQFPHCSGLCYSFSEISSDVVVSPSFVVDKTSSSHQCVLL